MIERILAATWEKKETENKGIYQENGLPLSPQSTLYQKQYKLDETNFPYH